MVGDHVTAEIELDQSIIVMQSTGDGLRTGL